MSAPQEPDADTVCTLDGMVLADFPGPKAQIQYVQGKPDFYCDLTELFAVLQAPENKRACAAVFVQDMGKADWDQPRGHWIAAEAALYVVGSKRRARWGRPSARFRTRRTQPPLPAGRAARCCRSTR
ncbi:nitrous oxide reductase accessory protein NosL [Massilia sp. H-1]|nr:nitrous oxide reductase accessory protein NosL [Massilia sp. H-1]